VTGRGLPCRSKTYIANFCSFVEGLNLRTFRWIRALPDTHRALSAAAAMGASPHAGRQAFGAEAALSSAFSGASTRRRPRRGSWWSFVYWALLRPISWLSLPSARMSAPLYRGSSKSARRNFPPEILSMILRSFANNVGEGRPSSSVPPASVPGSIKTALTTPSALARGRSVASTRRAAAPRACAFSGR
jgi:hypothetical protein